MIIKPGDVVLLRMAQERRGVNGLLPTPAQSFVCVYDEECNELRLEHVTPNVLWALAPDKARALRDAAIADRNKD